MIAQVTSLLKLKSIETASCIYGAQWYESRNQLKETKWEKHKPMVTEKHIIKNLMRKLRNQRGNQEIFLKKKWKWEHKFPKYEIQQKLMSDFNTNTSVPQGIRIFSYKSPKLPSKGIRKSRTKKAQSQ